MGDLDQSMDQVNDQSFDNDRVQNNVADAPEKSSFNQSKIFEI